MGKNENNNFFKFLCFVYNAKKKESHPFFRFSSFEPCISYNLNAVYLNIIKINK
jgi:hypothetical protein